MNTNATSIALHSGRQAPGTALARVEAARDPRIAARSRRRSLVWIVVSVAILATLVWLTAPPLASAGALLP